MNFDKKKDRPLFQRTVESGCIPFCRELLPDFSRCMFPILPLLFDIRSAVSQLPDAFRTLEKLGVRLKSRRDAERFFALYSAFHNTTRMPCNRFRASMPRPGGRLSAGTGKFFKEPRSLFPVAAWLRTFSYQTVDKTLTFHFLRATLELPTGQYWPRGNICLGGSLCRKLKKKR